MSIDSGGAQFANCFRTDVRPYVLTKPLPRGGTAAARLTYSEPAHGPARIPAQNAFVVLSLMRDLACGNLEIDGRPRVPSVLRAGEVGIFDLRSETVIDVQSPFDFVYLYFPQSALDRLADEHDVPRIVECIMQPGVSVPDPVGAGKVWTSGAPAGAALDVAAGFSPRARARAASNPAPAGERIPTVAQRASMRLTASMMPAMVPPHTPVGKARAG